MKYNIKKKIKVLMIGVSKNVTGGMLSVCNSFQTSKLYNDTVDLIYIPTVINGCKLRKILFFCVQYIKVLFCLLFKKISIVHIHMGERTSVLREGFLAKTALLFQKKTILHIHAAEMETWYSTLSKKKKEKTQSLFQKVNHIILLNSSSLYFFKNGLGCKNITVIYNGIEKQTRNLFNPNSKNLLFLGMIDKRKGIEDVIKAFSLIQIIHPNYRLQIYGDDKNNMIDSLLKKYKVEGKAFFNGWLNHSNLPSVFESTYLNLLPSYHEGMPMTILEAMSFGIPSITTNIDGMLDIIQNNKNGILINPGDVISLTNCIDNCINNKDFVRNLSAASFDISNTEFTIDKTISKVLLLYFETINEENKK